MTEAIEVVAPQAEPRGVLLALYAAGMDKEAEKFVLEMIPKTVEWVKRSPEVEKWFAMKGRALSYSSAQWAEKIRVSLLRQVGVAAGKEEEEEFTVRWDEAFKKAKAAPKASLTEKLNAAIAKQAESKAEPKQEEAKEEAPETESASELEKATTPESKKGSSNEDEHLRMRRSKGLMLKTTRAEITTSAGSCGDCRGLSFASSLLRSTLRAWARRSGGCRSAPPEVGNASSNGLGTKPGAERCGPGASRAFRDAGSRRFIGWHKPKAGVSQSPITSTSWMKWSNAPRPRWCGGRPRFISLAIGWCALCARR